MIPSKGFMKFILYLDASSLLFYLQKSTLMNVQMAPWDKEEPKKTPTENTSTYPIYIYINWLTVAKW